MKTTVTDRSWLKAMRIRPFQRVTVPGTAPPPLDESARVRKLEWVVLKQGRLIQRLLDMLRGVQK